MGNCNFSACCSRHVLCHRRLLQSSSYLHHFISSSLILFLLPAQELMKTHSGDPEYLLFNSSYVHHTSVLSLFFWVPYLRPGHNSNQQYVVSSRGAGRVVEAPSLLDRPKHCPPRPQHHLPSCGSSHPGICSLGHFPDLFHPVLQLLLRVSCNI